MSSIWVWNEPLFSFGKAKSFPPRPVELPNLPAVSKILSGQRSLVLLGADGTVWEWTPGLEAFDDQDAVFPNATMVTGLANVVDVESDAGSYYAIKADGTLWAWGANHSGQLGDGTTESRTTPVQVAGLTHVTSVTTEEGSTFAVQSDGSVWAWGRDHCGTLGDGTQALGGRQVTTPVKLPNLAGIVSVSTAFPISDDETAYALASGGTVWAWGDDRDGQIGDGTWEGRWIPVPVVGLSDVTALATSQSLGRIAQVTAFAVKSDGTVWAWGANRDGQLGDGTTTSRSLPAQVAGLTDVVAVSTSSNRVYALKSDGTVWHWGASLTRDGSSTVQPRPAQIAGLPKISRLFADQWPAHAIGIDGTVWRWGHSLDVPPSRVEVATPVSGIAQSALFSAALVDAAAMPLTSTEAGPIISGGHSEPERDHQAFGGDGNRGDKVDPAVEAWERAASRGDADAMLRLGLHFQQVGRTEEASYWLQRSANVGNPYAMYKLAYLRHLAGEDDEAIGLIQRASMLGLPQAKRALIEIRRPIRIGQADVELLRFSLDFSDLEAGGSALGHSASPAQALPNPASPASSPQSAPLATSRVEVFGSTQSGLSFSPTITIYWNGRQVGTVDHGGRFVFDIATTGEVRFKWKFRSRTLVLEPDAPTIRLQLEWDRIWGRLIASRLSP